MSELERLREEIGEADDALMALLERRTALARQIGAYKRAHGLPVLDEAREQAETARCVALLQNKENVPCAEAVLALLMRHAREAQQRDAEVFARRDATAAPLGEEQ